MGRGRLVTDAARCPACGTGIMMPVLPSSITEMERIEAETDAGRPRRWSCTLCPYEEVAGDDM